MIIGVSGKIKSGKSRVAECLSEIMEKKGKQVEIKSFARPIYEILSNMYEISVDQLKVDKQEKLPVYVNTRNTQSGFVMSDFRKLLQYIGNGLREYGDPDIWVDVLFGCNNKKVINTFANTPNMTWIIEDMRYPNEAERIRDLNGYLIRIERESHQLNNHVAENSLNDWTDWDLVINNDFPTKKKRNKGIKKILEEQNYERFF